MKKGTSLYLEDILEMINRIEKSTRNLTKSEFFENLDSQDMTIRRLEIIGEAVKQIPGEFKTKYPKIPWREIAGTRDILIHAYAGANLDRIWMIIQKDLKPLKNKLKSS